MASGVGDIISVAAIPPAGELYSKIKFLADEVVDYRNPVAEASGTHYITPILPDRVHYYVVKAVDEAGNLSDAACVKIEASGAPYPISNLRYSSLPGPKIYLYWQESPSDDVDHYNIYSNAGSGEIDYSSPIAQASGTYWQSEEILSSGVWKFNVRAVDKDGFEETNFHNEITIEDVENLGYPQPPSNLTATPISNGRIELSWDSSLSNDVKQYNIYHDAGSGSINYDEPFASVESVQDYIGRLRYMFVTPPLQHGVLYTFGVRAENIAGSEEKNTGVVASARADVLGPEKPSVSVSGFYGGRKL